MRNQILHNAIDIPDPSSMQDVCHMNFVIDLVIPYRDSEFFLYPMLVTRKKTSFSIFFTELKTYSLSYSIYNKTLITNLKHALNF